MLNWLFDRPYVLVGGLVVLIVGCLWLSSRDVDRRCGEVMALARTSRDSLDAKMACERIASDASRDMAIGFGAGIVAGSNAARR